MDAGMRCSAIRRLETWLLLVGLLSALGTAGCSDGAPADDDASVPGVTPPDEGTPSATPPPASPTPPAGTPSPTPGTNTLSASTSSLDFGSQTVDSSTSLPLVVTNQGASATQVLVAVAPSDGGFSVDASDVQLGPHKSATLTVLFSPDAAGPFSAQLVLTATGYPDVSVDLSGEGATSSADNDSDGFSAPDGDCDDNDDTVYPGAIELCDGKDNDCNGTSDEGKPTWYPDLDGDGYGIESGSLVTCAPGPGYALAAGDCDDADGGVFPGAVEACNARDDDCDGQIDEGLSQSTFYLDQDGDGFGGDTTVSACGPLPGVAAQTGDCDETRPTTYPGAQEVCDGQDSDCDGQIDEEGLTTYYVDHDGDGYGDPDSPVESCDSTGLAAQGDDCDDSSNIIYPGATEACDGRDNDCDGAIDDGAGKTFFEDADGDGFGSASATAQGCTAPAGYVSNSTDCNDLDPFINSSAPEVCDTVDNNCDGTADEGVGLTFYSDGDGDGFGDSSQPIQACSVPAGAAVSNGDCDDSEASDYPGAVEICDGADNNCDAQIDEGVLSVFYQDQDGDGYGTSTSTKACQAPSGYASASGDCNDKAASIHPGAVEACDSLDNDCDGKIDEEGETAFYLDYDKDGYGDPAISQVSCQAPAGYVSDGKDCNDRDASIHPNASETCNNKDDNCDNQIDEGVLNTYYLDADGDGYGRASGPVKSCSSPSSTYVTQGGDCDDLSATVYPGATESCNGKDDDCDTLKDEGVTTTYYADSDKDGYGDPKATTQACSAPSSYVADNTDCDDTAASTHPNAVELCNSKDDNCNTQIDEGAKSTFYLDTDSDGYGQLSATLQACSTPTGYAAKSGDCDDTASSTYPGAAELCDSKDNNCEGQIDEGVKVTFYYDADKDGYGDPASGLQACTAPSSRYVTAGTDCNDLDAAINPGATEVCDSKDNNCDKKIDDVDVDKDGYTPVACGGSDCNDKDASINVKGTEICDGADDNCNGSVDESDPGIDFQTDPLNCGSCGNVCGLNGQGPACLKGSCGSMPMYQHRWQNLTSIPLSGNWVTLTGSSTSIQTSGGALEIELNIPLIGGGNSACRPIVDGKWAGSFEGLPESYIWHEGLDYTGYNSGTIKRMWKRIRVYNNIPSGSHTVAAQCRTDTGTATAGRAGASALLITREYLGSNKVHQAVSLQGITMGVSAGMAKIPGTDLTFTTTSTNLEITISNPIGNGGHAGCLEWMDGALIPTTPAYSNTYWYAGLEATYRGWIMWEHTRTYTGIPLGTHTFSIRCYNDSGTLYIGYPDMASVIIVRELDESLYPSSQAIDAYGNGYEISSGTDSNWYTLPNNTTTINSKRGNLSITTHLAYHTVASGNYITCRPLVDGQWAGSFAGLAFNSNEEEGSAHEVFESTGWHGMWQRTRLYTKIPVGTHTVSIQCLSSASGYYLGYYANGSTTVRDVDVIQDQ